MTELEILQEARRLIARPYGWTRGHFVTKAPRCANGLAYCMMGALDAAAGSRRFRAVEHCEDLLKACAPNHVIAPFNDAPTTTKRDVLRAFDCAISKLEGETS